MSGSHWAANIQKKKSGYIEGVSQHDLTSSLQWTIHMQQVLPHFLNPEPAWHPGMNKDRACDQHSQFAGVSLMAQAVKDWRDMHRGHKSTTHHYNKWICFHFSPGSQSFCHRFHSLSPTHKLHAERPRAKATVQSPLERILLVSDGSRGRNPYSHIMPKEFKLEVSTRGNILEGKEIL